MTISIQPSRTTYLVKINDKKLDNKPLNSNDYLTVGYLAGRCGVNLANNPKEQNPIYNTDKGLYVNINTCTDSYFEKLLNQSQIKFNKIV